MSEPKAKGLEKLKTLAAKRANESRIQALKNTPTYVIKSAKQVLEANPKPPTEVWGGIYLNNDITEIIGPSGIGKSRIILNLALRQCLADTWPTHGENNEPIEPEFAGFPLYRGEVKWLLLGTENDLYRYHQDIKKMTAHCTPEQIDQLHKRLFMMTLEGEDDTWIALDGEGRPNFLKLQATIAQIMPDIVVFDPWGDLIGGDERSDQDVRDAVALLRKLRKGIKDQMAIVIVNHARMGASESGNAIGLEAANYGKNSKVLYTISRCVWNLAFLEDDLASNFIAFCNGKRSNGPLYPKKAVRLDSTYMNYETVKNIDVDERLRDLTSEASKPAQNKMSVRGAQNTDFNNRGIAVLKAELATGCKSKAYLESKLREAGLPTRIMKGIFEILTAGKESEYGSYFVKTEKMYGKIDNIPKEYREKAQKG